MVPHLSPFQPLATYAFGSFCLYLTLGSIVSDMCECNCRKDKHRSNANDRYLVLFPAISRKMHHYLMGQLLLTRVLSIIYLSIRCTIRIISCQARIRRFAEFETPSSDHTSVKRLLASRGSPRRTSAMGSDRARRHSSRESRLPGLAARSTP